MYLLANVHNGIIPSTSDQGCVRFNDDVVLLAVFHNWLLLTKWVKLQTRFNCLLPPYAVDRDCDTPLVDSPRASLGLPL